jgi:hypothetical protein
MSAAVRRGAARTCAALILITVPVAVVRTPAAAAVTTRPALTARAASAATVSNPTVTYEPPVDAPVDDPFRAPDTPYGAGHRGIEYDTVAGTRVAAAATGVVVFAGDVAGQQWVTILHADGVRTTYGPLATVAVTTGQRVQGGDPLGTTAGRLLLTARVGSDYVDPALLLATEGGEIRLVPEPTAWPSFSPSSFGIGDLLSPDAIVSALSVGRDVALQQATAIYGVTPVPFVLHSVDALVVWHERQSHCTSDDVATQPPSGRRFAILVGGLGSSSENAAVDDVATTSLGYDARDVVRFSYAGGRIPTRRAVTEELAGIHTSTYTSHDSAGDIAVAGHRLAAMLADAADWVPEGTTIDVFAHSQGGLVAREALDELASTDPDALGRIGLVVTLATPHEGAELAALVGNVTAAPFAGDVVDAGGAAAGTELRSDDAAIRQLAPGSDLLRSLASRPLPSGPHYLSIAAQGDPVVPSPDAHLAGADNVIVPVDGLDAHATLPGSSAATREMALALDGLPPGCESAVDAVLDSLWGDLFHSSEQFLAASPGP